MAEDALDEARRLYGSLTAADLGALDRAAVDSGVDILMLMEVAGLQVARCAWRMCGAAPQEVDVLAGRGNNGGDGLVAARHLRAWGCPVRAHVVGVEAGLRGAVARQVAAARGAGVEVSVSDDVAALGRLARASTLAVDALLGTGLRDAPRGIDAEAIRHLAQRRVLAVDVPSGLDASTGEPLGVAVRAEVTCTLTAVKTGLWTRRGREWAGDLFVADIGMPATAWVAAGLTPPDAVRGGDLLAVPAVVR